MWCQESIWTNRNFKSVTPLVQDGSHDSPVVCIWAVSNCSTCNKFCISSFREKLIKRSSKEVVIVVVEYQQWEMCVYVCAVLGFVPSVAVGVVGIGHVPGIVANWNQLQDVQQLLQWVAGSYSGCVIDLYFVTADMIYLNYINVISLPVSYHVPVSLVMWQRIWYSMTVMCASFGCRHNTKN